MAKKRTTESDQPLEKKLKSELEKQMLRETKLNDAIKNNLPRIIAVQNAK